MICATKNYGGRCQQDLFTLRPGDDPNDVIRALIEGATESASPLTQNNGKVRYYYSMDKLIDRLDRE